MSMKIFLPIGAIRGSTPCLVLHKLRMNELTNIFHLKRVKKRTWIGQELCWAMQALLKKSQTKDGQTEENSFDSWKNFCCLTSYCCNQNIQTFESEPKASLNTENFCILFLSILLPPSSHDLINLRIIDRFYTQILVLSFFPCSNKFFSFGPQHEYFLLYAKEHKAYDYIKFRHEVIQVVEAQDYDITGKWKVVVKDHETGQTSSKWSFSNVFDIKFFIIYFDTRKCCLSSILIKSSLILMSTIGRVFDSVMVCSGHHFKPLSAQFPGQEKFKGKYPAGWLLIID